jgi:iron complex transport system substrate-binding protein
MKIKQLGFVVALTASLLSFGSQAAERIISADAGVTAVLRALNLEKELVGIDVTSTQPTGAPLPVVGYHRQLATEGLLALKPTLLVGGEHMGPPATLSSLEAAGVKVLRVPQAQDGAGLLSGIRQLAEVVATQEQAKPVLEQVQQKLTTLQKQALPQNSRALFLLSAGSRGLRAAGVSTGGDALIRLMGASNVMTYNSYQPISAEAIMATNPDIIFLAADGSKNAMADFLRDYPTLSTLKAAQTQKIVEVRSETLVAGLSVLTVDEALRLQTFLQQQAVKN